MGLKLCFILLISFPPLNHGYFTHPLRGVKQAPHCLPFPAYSYFIWCSVLRVHYRCPLGAPPLRFPRPLWQTLGRNWRGQSQGLWPWRRQTSWAELQRNREPISYGLRRLSPKPLSSKRTWPPSSLIWQPRKEIPGIWHQKRVAPLRYSLRMLYTTGFL